MQGCATRAECVPGRARTARVVEVGTALQFQLNVFCTMRPKGRRADRLSVGPLHVQVHPRGAGTLVNINEFGALLNLQEPADVGSYLSFDIHGEHGVVTLRGRVVRSTAVAERARLEWTDAAAYAVAVEFMELPEPAAAVRKLVRK